MELKKCVAIHINMHVKIYVGIIQFSIRIFSLKKQKQKKKKKKKTQSRMPER